MPHPSIGIDLGTTTTIVSVFRNGRPEPIKDAVTKTPLIPSVVALDRRGGLLVGQSAIDRGLPGKIVREAKRDMGTERVFELGEHRLRPEEVAAMVLRYAKENAERFLGEPIEEAVITVPAYFGDLERRATYAAAQIAGLRVKRLINEPTAAAMAYGLDRLEEETTAMVVDLGGGTLDVTVFEMIEQVLDVKTSHGDKELGGKDMDEAIIRWATNRLQTRFPELQPTPEGREKLKQVAEAAKKALSSSQSTEIFVLNFGLGSGDVQNVDETLTVSEFNAMIEPDVQRCLRIVDDTLNKGGLKKSNIKRLLLVGGSTYVPRVREALENHLALAAERSLDPDLAVSAGASISAGLADDLIPAETGLVVQDICNKSLGIHVVSDIGGQEILTYSELITPNTPIPYYTKRSYQLQRPDQTELEIDVAEAPFPNVVLATGTSLIGPMMEVRDIPPALYGEPHRVDVEFSYDVNQMVVLTATVPGTNRAGTMKLNVGSSNVSALQDSVTRLDSLWETAPLAGRHQKIVQRAEGVLKDRPSNAEAIEAALVDLKAAIAGNDADAAQKARERLTDQLARI